MLLLATEWVDDLLAANATTSLEFMEIAGFELLKITGLEFVVVRVLLGPVVAVVASIEALARLLDEGGGWSMHGEALGGAIHLQTTSTVVLPGR